MNKYFMKRAKEFIDGFAKDVLGIEYCLRRVDFTVERGQIHLNILGIAKNKAYLIEFYRAETEQETNRCNGKVCAEDVGLNG